MSGQAEPKEWDPIAEAERELKRYPYYCTQLEGYLATRAQRLIPRGRLLDGMPPPPNPGDPVGSAASWLAEEYRELEAVHLRVMAIRAVLAQLDERDRRFVELRYFRGRPMSHCVQILNAEARIPEEQVSRRTLYRRRDDIILPLAVAALAPVWLCDPPGGTDLAQNWHTKRAFGVVS